MRAPWRSSAAGAVTVGGIAVAAVILLAAGVLIATAVAQSPSSGGVDARGAGAVALNVRDVDAEHAAAPPSPLGTVPPLPGPSSTISAPAPAPTATSRPATPTTLGRPPSTATVPPPTPIVSIPGSSLTLVPTTTTPVPGRTSWSTEHNGITLRMRMEPAAPLPGLPVRFIVDITAVDSCCATGLAFGDGPTFIPVAGAGAPGTCASTTNFTGAVVTHTYEGPGLYAVTLVATTFPCQPTVVDGVPVPSAITGAQINACVAVGRAIAYHEPCS
jgi:hypothetical protein